MDNSQGILQGSFTKAPIDYPVIAKEMVEARQDPLSLEIDDDELARISKKRIDDDQKFYEQKYHLSTRRHKNEVYYFGRQVAERERKGELKEYESRNQDNALYEIMATIKPLAMTHLPDMIVTAGKPGDKESEQAAEDLGECVDSDIKSRNNRKVLGLAFKHFPVYFMGCIKARWDPQLGESGDYVFEVIHPDNIIFDHFCTTNNADDMSYVAQSVSMTVQELVMRFPDKKEEVFAKLKTQGLMLGENPTWKDLASPIKIWEIWSDWYKRNDTGKLADTQPPLDKQNNKWEKVSGVIWKYDDIILKKMKNPNYDHEGEEKIFTYEVAGDPTTKKELGAPEALAALVTGVMPPNVSKEQIYHNFFDMPRKPFFFMGYDQWGKQPMDETSWLEQNLHNQEILDRRGKQIDEMLSDRGKHVFSKDGGLKPDDIERMDMNDPKQDILVEGDVNKVHSFIAPEQPSPQEFASINDTRARMYGISGSSAIRGTMQSNVATTNQIAREADFTRADDVVEDTINAASEWMSQWAMQFIRLRYTEDHFRKLLGDKGKVMFIKLHRDLISDGMEVMIKASGTDKLKAQNNAMQMATLKMIDPITFFEDMGLSDPQGRAKKLLTFMGDPASYMAEYVMETNTPQLVDGLLGAGAAQALGGGQGAATASPGGGTGQVPAPAGINAPPVAPTPINPTPNNTAAIPAAPPVTAPQGSPRGM
jgi:hypothetical protein